ncbi:MAG TPA: glycosyltransferase, partial [Agriterribacter sp.]|nr:glycosyltransferase [Agriterribacter sp.]
MAVIKQSVVIFTDWYEPGFKAGGPIRSCVNFAAHMKEDYSIYVFTGDRDLGEQWPYEGIEANRWIERDGIKLYYASPGGLNWESILVHIREIKPDFIYLNSMFSRYFTIYPLLMQRFGLFHAKLVLAPRGMLKSAAVQFKSGKKSVFFQLLKLMNIPRRIIFQATDILEVADIRSRFGDSTHVKEISNFPPIQKPLRNIAKKEGELSIIFIGRLHPIKNLDYLLSILLHVSAKIKLTIIATIEDEAYWGKCRAIIDNFSESIEVRLQQDVPHPQIEQVINDHHLFVLPTLGENFGHAIFEALSAGRPVLISDQTPWHNLLEYHAGWDLALSDTHAFVQVLQQVADMDDVAYQQWSIGAWQYAKQFSESSNL